jgi:hypothetical protein
MPLYRRHAPQERHAGFPGLPFDLRYDKAVTRSFEKRKQHRTPICKPNPRGFCGRQKNPCTTEYRLVLVALPGYGFCSDHSGTRPGVQGAPADSMSFSSFARSTSTRARNFAN